MEDISKVFEQLIHQATGEKRKYTKQEWVKRRQPRRARFLAKVLWYDKGTTGPFYGYDYEKRKGGEGEQQSWKNKETGEQETFMHNEHLGLIKLLHWLEEEKKRWYCCTIYMTTEGSKLTGKYKDERAVYTHEVFKVVNSRNAAKRIRWFNESVKFDDNGLVRLDILKDSKAPKQAYNDESKRAYA